MVTDSLSLPAFFRICQPIAADTVNALPILRRCSSPGVHPRGGGILITGRRSLRPGLSSKQAALSSHPAPTARAAPSLITKVLNSFPRRAADTADAFRAESHTHIDHGAPRRCSRSIATTRRL